ncbi:hypothetical protein [Paracoccus sp. SM22M-07]|uniref:hypothetical protein n=1 Tax=Paracoccus sp. SM22M-07 TaxID=1520813 RepID=UPI001114F49B|nr:hypothetical protein [Paracoccus sp. SM22M-07]
MTRAQMNGLAIKPGDAGLPQNLRQLADQHAQYAAASTLNDATAAADVQNWMEEVSGGRN